jgi:hypothetical protein
VGRMLSALPLLEWTLNHQTPMSSLYTLPLASSLIPIFTLTVSLTPQWLRIWNGFLTRAISFLRITRVLMRYLTRHISSRHAAGVQPRRKISKKEDQRVGQKVKSQGFGVHFAEEHMLVLMLRACGGDMSSKNIKSPCLIGATGVTDQGVVARTVCYCSQTILKH